MNSVARIRKPRVAIFDEEISTLAMLRDFLTMQGYEVFVYSDPAAICPLYGVGGDVCAYTRSCADVMLADFNLPGVNGVELFQHQTDKGCRLDIRNKAVVGGYLDAQHRRKIGELGCAYFRKPFTPFTLASWLAECETRMDLTQPLASRRSEERIDNYHEIRFRMAGADRVHAGITVNLSNSGLCLQVPVPLRERDTIDIEGGDFVSCGTASVRWVKKVNDSAYLAGLRCLG